MFDLARQGKIGKTIAVARQKFFLPLKVGLYRLQPLTDVGIDAGVSKCNPPIVNIAIE
jgi:hypothetical protein